MRPYHEKNDKITGFCSHPDSVVTLSVLPENEDKLRFSVYAGDEAPDKAFVFVYDVDENNWYVFLIYVSCSQF